MELQLTLKFKDDLDILAFGDEEITVTLKGIGPGTMHIRNRLKEKYEIVDCQVISADYRE
jgi:hypothetical protein